MKMLNEMLIAGFGGQGIVTLGKLIAYAGMLEGMEVCCWPRYGAEMRGGTAYCTVILSSEAVDSPMINVFDTVVVMNYPSLVQYQDKVRKGGLLFWNSSVIFQEPQRKDVEKIAVDATNIASNLGNTRIANIVFLGGLLKKTGLFSLDSATIALQRVFTRMTPEMFRLDRLALQKGGESVNPG